MQLNIVLIILTEIFYGFLWTPQDPAMFPKLGTVHYYEHYTV